MKKRMDTANIEELLSLIGSLSLGVVIGAAVVYLFMKFFLPSYISEKGKNLATKEDIASITDKVESVKTDYAKVLEELRNDNQIRLAAIEREKNIKKEVYLQAVEALTRTQNVVGSLTNLNIDEQKATSSMVNDSGLIAKIQIVGSEKTVKAVSTIMASIGTAIMELMLERKVLVERKTRIEFLEGLRSKSQNEIERYISIMKNLNLEGNQDKRLWNTINNQVEFETQQRDKFMQETSNLWKAQNKEHLEFTQKCMNKYFEISSLLPNAVLAVREELNLPISDEAYINIFNKNMEQGRQVFSKFFGKLAGK